MRIIAFNASPRAKGMNAKLVEAALEGARSTGAETHAYRLSKQEMKFCLGCFKCAREDLELPLGKCVHTDDVEAMLKDIQQADGYLFSSPVYVISLSAIMKTFLERMFPLFTEDVEDENAMPEARVPADLLKKAALFVTGNSPDDFAEAMGGSAFDTMDSLLMLLQVETIERFFVGSVSHISDEALIDRLKKAHTIGRNLVESINNAQSS